MRDPSCRDAARDRAVASARRIFYRPESIVDSLIASFTEIPSERRPGRAAIAQACYERPIRMGATLEVFGLRLAHWPMLNLLDRADHDRRMFADAMAAAVTIAHEDAATRSGAE